MFKQAQQQETKSTIDVRIEILKKGDKVINVFPYGEMITVSVQRKSGEVDIVLLENDGTDQSMRVGRKITICQGDDVVVLKKGDVTLRKL